MAFPPGEEKSFILFGSVRTSEREVRDMVKAWLAISLAFAIMLSGSLFSEKFLGAFMIAGFTVGIGVILHELAHKLVAQHYGCSAEFRSFDTMLILAIVLSFFGFLFAAPGAVFIHGPVGKRRNGMISLAGPATNLLLAAAFGMFAFAFPQSLLQSFLKYGYVINSWLALFNLLPILNFDGAKVLAWSRSVFGISLGLAILSQVLNKFI